MTFDPLSFGSKTHLPDIVYRLPRECTKNFTADRSLTGKRKRWPVKRLPRMIAITDISNRPVSAFVEEWVNYINQSDRPANSLDHIQLKESYLFTLENGKGVPFKVVLASLDKTPNSDQ